MRISAITYADGETATILEPQDGYQYITNGSIFSDYVVLGKNDNVKNWYDTNELPEIEVIYQN